MTTMKHRLALTICNSALFRCCWKDSGENVEASKQCASCGSLASAILKELKEPSAAMVKAGTVNWDAMDGSPIRPMFDSTKPYQAMIDAALAEKVEA